MDEVVAGVVRSYRKHPVVIDALRFSGGRESYLEIKAFTGDSFICWWYNHDTIGIETTEGTAYVNPGDWIVKGANGDFHKCLNADFAKTYEPVESVAAPKLESSTLEDAYFDRNQAVMAFAIAAQILGFAVGVKEDPEWPILFVDLPTGQVSWHIPAAEFINIDSNNWLPYYAEGWDGHTLEEKRNRIRQWIELELEGGD